jgi:septal ring factor EnvC (AmiA/AmiB activator)
VRELRTARETAAQTLNDGLQGAQTARAALGQAISDRTDLPLRFDDDPVQTALLIASAQTLGDFAGELTGQTPASGNTLTATANLPLPVVGIVLPYDRQGRPGVRIAAAPRALVTTPVAATLLFRGPLLDYGNVVIIEPTADVLFVLAGLAEVFGEPGEILSAGAPIGLLGGTPASVDGILTENTDIDAGQGQQTLYLEVREGQSAINPDTWFALE